MENPDVEQNSTLSSPDFVQALKFWVIVTPFTFSIIMGTEAR